MTRRELIEVLSDLLERALEAVDDPDDDLHDLAQPLKHVVQLAFRGETGLCVHTSDKHEFQITIVQSR